MLKKIINPLMIWNDPGVEIIWQVISFFASEPEKQMSMIGPTRNWFIEENDKNPGANYLLGMAFAYYEYRLFICDLVTSIAHSEFTGIPYDPNTDNHTIIFDHITNQLEKMKTIEVCWSINALFQVKNWRYLRKLSKNVFNLYGFEFHIMAEPFWYPDIFHIDEWGDPDA